MFTKSMVKMTILLAKDGTALHLHFEFCVICMRITKSFFIEFIRNFTIYLSMI